MYLDYYGLKQKPFESTPDPYFFYLSYAHKEALAAIQYGVRESKGIVLISGDVGTGKTTLIQTYLGTLDSSVISIYVDYPFASMSQLLRYISDKLDIPVSQNVSPLHLVEVITRRLVELTDTGGRVVLIFDEAQHFNVKVLEFIRLLSNIQTRDRKLINIVLVGQPELIRKIESPELRQLRQRIAIQRMLTPLSFDETVNYIKHRLLAAGASGDLFSKGAMRIIFNESRGIPRLINILCDGALLAGFVSHTRIVEPPVVKRVIRESFPERSYKFRWKRVIVFTFACIIIVGGWIAVSKMRSGKDAFIEVRSSHFEADPESFKSSLYRVRIDGEALEDLRIREFDGEGVSEVKRSDLGGDFHGRDVLSIPSNFEPVIKEAQPAKGVKPQDVLAGLIMETYGKNNETLLDIVLQHNPSIKNINLIYAGQKIIMPDLAPETLIFKSSEGKYFVHYYSSYQAEKLMKKARELGSFNFPNTILLFDQNGRNVYRIYIGPFDSVSDAKKALLSLPKDHLPSGILRERH